MRLRTNESGPTRAAANGVWHDDQFGFFAIRLPVGPGCDGSRANSAFNDERHTYSFSLKIRPDLGVFFVADSADSFQIISASEWSRRNNSSRHYISDPWHRRQFFFCRCIDVDFPEWRLFFWMRSVRLGCSARRGWRTRWRGRK